MTGLTEKTLATERKYTGKIIRGIKGQKGQQLYRLILTMPETMSVERRKLATA